MLPLERELPGATPFRRLPLPSPLALRSLSAQAFIDPARPEFALRDLELCLQVDCFDFAMPVHPAGSRLAMRPSYPSTQRL